MLFNMENIEKMCLEIPVEVNYMIYENHIEL